MKSRKVAGAGALLAAAVMGAAALLQWFWAGWSVYSGGGPSLAMRWLLTGAVGAALLLPVGSALIGAAVGQRIANAGLRDQVRVTRSGAGRLVLLASGWALATPLLAALLSAAAWSLVSVVAGGHSGLPGPGAIGGAHALVGAMSGAFALWGLALCVGRRGELRSLGPVARAGIWAPVAVVLLAAGPVLVSPVLPRLARPERALDGVLLVNPVTAVGAALGTDVLRSPRVYGLTRAPEYWYTYPPASAVAGFYIVAAGLGARRLRRRLESE